MVGISKTGTRTRMLRFRSPTTDGKISNLEFGLIGDVADALLELLYVARIEEMENDQPQPTQAKPHDQP